MWAQGAKINKRSEAKVDGVYMNIKVQVKDTYTFGERGTVGIPYELEWGSDDGLIRIDAENFVKECKKLLGYSIDDPKLTNIVEAIKGGASKIFIYKLNHGEKASSKFGTARCSGTVGNLIDLVIEQDPDAGVGYHPLKDTTAEVSAKENVVTVNVKQAPQDATFRYEVEKESGDPAEASKYQVSSGNPATISFEQGIEAGNYKIKTYVNELLLDTASITLEAVEATEAKMQVSKDQEIVDGINKEDLAEVSVEVTASGDNKATITYTGLSETQKPEVKVLADSVIVGNEADKVNVSTQENTVTVTFGKLLDASKKYSLQINVLDSDVPKDYGKQNLTIVQDGENKAAYTKASYSTSEKEDYSAEIPNRFIVQTFVGTDLVDTQKVKLASNLKDNDYVIFNKSATLEQTAGENFVGGTNGTVTGDDWQKARDMFETSGTNVIAVPVIDPREQKTWVEYTKRLRDKYGFKFQIVTPYLEEAEDYNYEGVIVVANKLKDEDLTSEEKIKNIVYWVAGAEAGCAVQNSCVAKEYTGAYEVGANYTFQQQEQCIDNGLLYFHLVDGIPTIGKDINTLTHIDPELIEEKSLQFKQNQAIRVLDALCLDTAKIFNTYFLGKAPNDERGRSDLKNRIIENREAYANLRAIDTYDPSNLSIEAGEEATDVIGRDAIRLLNVMEYLFFTIEVLSWN